jgi:hypothetical protein
VVNEFLADFYDGQESYLGQISTDHRRKLGKHWGRTEAWGKTTTGVRAYLAAKALIDLQHWLTHYKPHSSGLGSARTRKAFSTSIHGRLVSRQVTECQLR